MLDTKMSTVTNYPPRKQAYMNFSLFGFFMLFSTFVLTIMTKEYLLNVLIILETKAHSNIIQFHIVLILLYILMSLPVLSPYLVCILISSYVYGFFYGMPLVVFYTVIGMTFSFFICRYMFFDYAHTHIKSLNYLNAISSLIQSNEKGKYLNFTFFFSSKNCSISSRTIAN